MDKETKQAFDQLVDLIQAGFSDTNARIDSMDQRLSGRIDKLYEGVDGFIELYKKVDLEIVSLRAYCQRLEERIVKLERE